MSKNHDKDEIVEEILESEAQETVDVFEEQEEIIEEQQEEIQKDESKIAKLKDMLARSAADLENFKKRTERDKADTMFYLKSDILSKVLPRIDDLERILDGTPENERSGSLYEGILSLHKSLTKDLGKMGVVSFISKGEEVDPDKHEVMTQIPGKEGIIIDEFEKGYMLSERVLRVAKVVVGSGE